MKNFFIALILLILVNYKSANSRINFVRSTLHVNENNLSEVKNTSLIILGTIQDGGSPHIGCKKNCCRKLFNHPDQNRKVVSLGIIDPENKKKFIFEATPDLTFQMKKLVENSLLILKKHLMEFS